MRIVIVGGGTGSTPVLNGLKKYKDLQLGVVVSMGDDGDSNAVLRDEFGILPLSDVRKSILALSELEDQDTLRRLMTYRFAEGAGLVGHTLGNLMMTALTKITGKEEEAIEVLSELFHIRGDIYIASKESYRLNARYKSGREILGEHLIDEPDIDPWDTITEFKIVPSVKANRNAVGAIYNADYIILGPGDLYTTTLAVTQIDEINKALRDVSAPIIYITNLMSKVGQTKGLTQAEILETLERYLGRKVNYILQNNYPIDREVLRTYARSGEYAIKDDLGIDPRVIRASVISRQLFKPIAGDRLVRSLVRHDSALLSEALYGILKK